MNAFEECSLGKIAIGKGFLTYAEKIIIRSRRRLNS